MKIRHNTRAGWQQRIRLITLALLTAFSTSTLAWLNADQTLELHGFLDSTTHQRVDYGISKQRFRGQLEFNKQMNNFGPFVGISLNGTVRMTYDGVYDFNSDQFGTGAGGPVTASSSGSLAGLTPTTANGFQSAWGASPVSAGVPLLPGGGPVGLAAGPPGGPDLDGGSADHPGLRLPGAHGHALRGLVRPGHGDPAGGAARRHADRL